MKKIIAYFIKYHVAVNIIVLSFFVFGLVGIFSLKSSFFPLIDSKFVTIGVTYLGASPEEVEEGVVLKIEDNLKGLSGIERVTSSARENGGTILIEIEQNEDINVILLEVKNAVDRVPSFPIGMEPLVVAKQEQRQPTIVFSLSGSKVPLSTLKEIGRKIENDLRGIEGISQIRISGYPDEEIEIALNENDLLAYNLTFDEVVRAVGSTNILVTGGNIKTESEEYLIRASNRSYYGRELSNLIVRADLSGKIIRLKDIAVVRDRFSETPSASYIDDDRSIIFEILSTNNEDLLLSAETVREYIEDFNSKYTNVKLDTLVDWSVVLRQRTNLLLENGAIGIILVLLFLSLFLNIRLAFWVAFGLPISFLGMFIFAPQLGVTINIMSLFGMIVVIGILVDDGIVIAENIYQNFEKGKSATKAAIDGTLEVMAPILSAVITTIIAFATLILLDGQVGEFFGEVATIVILTLTVSLIEALIILPAHLAHSNALKPKAPIAASPLSKFFASMRKINKLGNELMIWLREKIYGPTLSFALKNRLLSFSGFVAALLLTIGSIGGGIIGVTFFPTVASDRVTVSLSMPKGTSVKITDSIISMIEEKARILNEELSKQYLPVGDKKVFKNITKNVGSAADGAMLDPSIGATGGSANASLSINMLSGEERPDVVRASMVGNRLREMVGPIIGSERIVYGTGVNFGGSPVSVSLLSNNIEELKMATEELKLILRSNSLITDIADTNPEGIKEIRLKLKENAYMLGLTLQSVMRQVRSGFFGAEVQRFQRGQDEIRVWVRYDRKNRSYLNNLDEMRIVTPSKNRVPLTEIAEYTIERGDVTIDHLNGKREIQITADLKDPNQSASDIVANIRNVVLPQLQAKYPTISASFEGQNREANKIIKSATKIFPMALFLIFATIGFTFRSYSQPFILLLLIPFSLTTVAWGHLIHGFPINIISLLGIIALIGIMVNDGLVLITRFNKNLREGLSFDESLYQAGKSRFRAIFLTSLTTVAGLAPLLLEKSFQAQLLKPMAISIAYGIGYATFLTLIMLPIFISFTNSAKTTFVWLSTGKSVQKKDVEAPIKELKELEGYDE